MAPKWGFEDMPPLGRMGDFSDEQLATLVAQAKGVPVEDVTVMSHWWEGSRLSIACVLAGPPEYVINITLTETGPPPLIPLPPLTYDEDGIVQPGQGSFPPDVGVIKRGHNIRLT
jgi:hypothetical protein